MSPYSKFAKEELILRDHLARDRTILANERTFLSYSRTGLTLFVAGISLVKFFDSLVIHIIGWVFIPLSIIVFIRGVSYYRRVKKVLSKIEQKNSIVSK